MNAQLVVREIYRNNLPNAFGVWRGRVAFGVLPLAIFETYEQARAYAEAMK